MTMRLSASWTSSAAVSGEARARYRSPTWRTPIDVQARTVKAWRDGDTLPQWTALLRLCCHFGPAFTSELLTPAGLGGVERVAQTDADPEGTVADLVEATHNLCERLRDRVFCHRDCRESGPRLLELSRTLEARARAMMAMGAV